MSQRSFSFFWGIPSQATRLAKTWAALGASFSAARDTVENTAERLRKPGSRVKTEHFLARIFRFGTEFRITEKPQKQNTTKRVKSNENEWVEGLAAGARLHYRAFNDILERRKRLSQQRYCY